MQRIASILLGSLLMLPPLAVAEAACLPTQGCNVLQQQPSINDLQRQLNSQRMQMQQDDLEQQRLRTQLQQSSPQTTPLQQLNMQQQLRDSTDNLHQSQQDYWRAENALRNGLRQQNNGPQTAP